jgi:hypothetical protein
MPDKLLVAASHGSHRNTAGDIVNVNFSNVFRFQPELDDYN